MEFLVKSAKVINPESPFHQKEIDILVENGKIRKIASIIQKSNAQKISEENLHVSIGWFDSSVNFGEPGYEERETLENGLKTALKSGFTAIALNPETYPITDNHTAVSFLKKQSGNYGVSLYPVGALTKNSQGKELAELYDMAKAGAVSFGDYKLPISNPNLLKIALQYVQAFGGLVQSFPQENAIARNGQVHEGHFSTLLGLKAIPAFAEELQIARDLYILEYTGGKLHIPTISTANSVKLIKEAKKKGLDVSCSVAIHNLMFTDENLQEFDANHKVLPPLRTKVDTKALLKGIKEGVIDMLTTDHKPVDIEHKKMEFENADYGSIGLESAFGAANQLLGTEKTIEMLTKGRKRFNIEQPIFAEGEMADFTLFSPTEKYIFSAKHISSSAKNSIFLQQKMKGKTIASFCNKHCSLDF